MHKVLLLMSDFLQKKSAYAAIYKDNDDEWLPPTLVTEGSVLLLSLMEDCRVGLAASSQRQFFVARRLYLVYRAWYYVSRIQNQVSSTNSRHTHACPRAK